MKFSTRHIEFEEIIKLAENDSASELSSAKANHLGSCAECSVQLRQLKNLFSLAPKEFPETVSQATTAHLLNIYRQPAAKTRKSLTNRLAGLLIFDDWKPEFALNERLSFQDTRQLLYKAGDYTIDLRVHLADDRFLISGQIFPEAFAAVVRIYNAKISLETSLNEDGEFDFPPFDEGNFNLQIVTENETIELNDISLA
jgi:hypothetical protein